MKINAGREIKSILVLELRIFYLLLLYDLSQDDNVDANESFDGDLNKDLDFFGELSHF
jgi:hypothetical protein